MDMWRSGGREEKIQVTGCKVVKSMNGHREEWWARREDPGDGVESCQVNEWTWGGVVGEKANGWTECTVEKRELHIDGRKVGKRRTYF